MYRADEFSEEQLAEFIKENYETCKGYAEEFFAGDMQHAAEYLLNQI